MNQLMKTTRIVADMEIAPFTRTEEDEKNRKVYIPCAHVTYKGDDTPRAFVVGGQYDREIDAYEASVTVIAALFRLCDPSQQTTALPELVRLALADHIPPESATPHRPTRHIR